MRNTVQQKSMPQVPVGAVRPFSSQPPSSAPQKPVSQVPMGAAQTPSNQPPPSSVSQKPMSRMPMGAARTLSNQPPPSSAQQKPMQQVPMGAVRTLFNQQQPSSAQQKPMSRVPMGEPRGPMGEPRGPTGEPRGPIREPRGPMGEPRGPMQGAPTLSRPVDKPPVQPMKQVESASPMPNSAQQKPVVQNPTGAKKGGPKFVRPKSFAAHMGGKRPGVIYAISPTFKKRLREMKDDEQKRLLLNNEYYAKKSVSGEELERVESMIRERQTSFLDILQARHDSFYEDKCRRRKQRREQMQSMGVSELDIVCPGEEQDIQEVVEIECLDQQQNAHEAVEIEYPGQQQNSQEVVDIDYLGQQKNVHEVAVIEFPGKDQYVQEPTSKVMSNDEVAELIALQNIFRSAFQKLDEYFERRIYAQGG